MLRINCPSCSSQFKVGEEFLGKYVECGSCEYQFTVSDENIVSEQKKNHYPVHKHNDLSNFSKTFDKVGATKSVSYNQEANQSKIKPDHFMPLPIWKQAVHLLGIGFLITGTIIMILGSLKNGFLMDAGYDKRFIISGFIALVSTACFLISARYFKDAIGKVLGAVFLMSLLAYFLPKYESPSADGKFVMPEKKVEVVKDDNPLNAEYITISKLKEICRYSPVEEALRAAKKRGDKDGYSVIGIWLQGKPTEHQYAIQDFYKNSLRLKTRPNFYPRKYGALILLENMRGSSLQNIALMSEIFGDLNEIYAKDRLISVNFDTPRFMPTGTDWADSIADVTHTNFYQLNNRELGHFDQNRVMGAVNRLKTVAPRYTGDINRSLFTVLSRFQNQKLINETCECLLIWVGAKELPKYSQQIDQVAAYSLRGLKQEAWPANLVKLALSADSEKMKTTVLALWKKEPLKWEQILSESKHNFAETVSTEIEPDNRNKNLSIIRIIGNSELDAKTELLNKLRTQLDDSYKNAIDSATR